MRLKMALFIVVAALLAVPVALANNQQDAAKACHGLQAQLGTATFKQTYGTNYNKTNAFGKCVAKMTSAAAASRQAATSACTAEQSDVNFAAAHNGQTFAQYYGVGKKDKNAFAHCVATKYHAALSQAVQKVVNGAQACKAELRSTGKAAFDAKYGKNGNKRNAFGKCVVAYVQSH